MYKIFVLALLIASAYADEEDVVDLGDDNFDSRLADMDYALVMFYAPWCGHCKRLKPEFARAATDLKSNDPPVSLVKVDCTEAGKSTCSRFGVSGYPTVKIFKNGELSSDYNGPREYKGIVKYMMAQAGPVSKELKNLADTESFLAKEEVAVVFFGQDGSLRKLFMEVAELMRESVRFGHVSDEETLKKYGFEENIVLFRPKQKSNKFEPDNVKFEAAESKVELKKFIQNQYHGLVGHRTQATSSDFRQPFVFAYYDVDYSKNPKGTNYWRNRVLKVAKDFADDFTFAINNNNDFAHETEEYGLNYVNGEKPVVCAKDSNGQKFIMKEDFSMDNLKAFLTALKAGELEAFVKSEDIPESQGNVIVAVGKNFDEVVTNSGRDALIEFYAPWCGHCKKLAPVYEELGEKLAGEAVDIIKMDATANDVPPQYNVRGFPTLFWKDKDGNISPYEGGRELEDLLQFVSKKASSELNNFTRNGKQKDEL